MVSGISFVVLKKNVVTFLKMNQNLEVSAPGDKLALVFNFNNS